MSEVQLLVMPGRRRIPLNAITVRWYRLIEIVFDPYRPELHYMRGPGPKWHAKRQDRIERAGR